MRVYTCIVVNMCECVCVCVYKSRAHAEIEMGRTKKKKIGEARVRGFDACTFSKDRDTVKTFRGRESLRERNLDRKFHAQTHKH